MFLTHAEKVINDNNRIHNQPSTTKSLGVDLSNSKPKSPKKAATMTNSPDKKKKSQLMSQEELIVDAD